ncbi:MAG: AbgT family transporter [Limnochordia bacterium]|jgi:aminobenzoyl-glutamate transport protein
MGAPSTRPRNSKGVEGILGQIERLGNRLPDPASIFIILAAAVLIFSQLGELFGWKVIHPGTGKEIMVLSLLNGDGFRKIIDTMMNNFAGFAPLPTVLCIMMGVGVAEGSGMIDALLRRTVTGLKPVMVTLAIVFLGINLNAASDAGFIILPPIAAMLLIALGRHPFIGIAAGYGAVAAGFNACILLSTIDVILAGTTETAARLVSPAMTVNPAVNWYFMMASVLPLTLVGVWVTEKLIAPRYSTFSLSEKHRSEGLKQLTDRERQGLKAAGVAFLICLGLLVIGIVPGGVLRNPQTGGLIPSSLITGMVFIMTILFMVPGIAYGRAVGKIKKDSDVVRLAAQGVAGMGGYIVLIFLASQFIAWFNWSNLGIFIAIKGADFLKGIGLVGIPLAVSFIIVACIINVFIGSATAKWALISSVFVPMFILLGFNPALTQVAYRIGDSITNAVSPLFPYFPILVGFLQKYDKEAGIGTAFSLMLPYSIVFFIVWMVLLIVWMLLGLPLGPGGPIMLSG